MYIVKVSVVHISEGPDYRGSFYRKYVRVLSGIRQKLSSLDRRSKESFYCICFQQLLALLYIVIIGNLDVTPFATYV